MLCIVNDETHVVKSIVFEKPVKYGYGCPVKFGERGHIGFAEDIVKSEGFVKAYSVIIVAERMEHELYDDPKHCIQTNHLMCSEVSEEARKLLINKYWRDEKLEELCKKYDLKQWKTNDPKFQKKDSERDFKFVVEDALFETQEMLLFPELINNVTSNAKYVLDEEGYPIEDEQGEYILQTDEKEVERQYHIILERILMPRVRTSYERQALMPHPFDHWDWRNHFQQYFFVEYGDVIYVDRGGSGSSGAREHQGRYAHILASLAVDNGIESQTTYFRYNKRNEFVWLGYSPEFKAMNRELSGNYGCTNRDEIKRLFNGRLVGITEDDGIEVVERGY